MTNLKIKIANLYQNSSFSDNITKVDTYSHELCSIKLMKENALRKQGLHEKKAASVLLKLFISGNE